MKKIFTLCSVLTITLSTFAYTHQLDSVARMANAQMTHYQFTYNEQHDLVQYIQASSAGKFQYTCMQNGAGLDTAISTKKLVGSTWQNYLYTRYSYDAQQRISEVHLYKMEDSQLIDSMQTLYTYSGTNLVRIENYIAKNGDGVLSKKSKIEYSYVGDNISECINYTTNSDAWKMQNRNVYTYSDGLLVLDSYQYRLDTEWIDSKKTRYTYDSSNNLVAIATIGYDDFDEAWNYNDSTCYIYTADGDLQEADKYTYNSDWDKTWTYAYDYTNVTPANCAGYEHVQAYIGNADFNSTLTLASYVVKKYSTIVEQDNYYYHSYVPSQLTELNTTSDIYTCAGRVIANEPIRIYNLAGLDVTSQNGNLNGIYIVKTATSTVKVVVR